MSYLPIHLDVRGRRVVVIGGGRVASRKAADLRRCGACVTVVAEVVSPPLRRLGRSGRLALRERKYRAGDLKGFFLAVAATDDPVVQAAIRKEATRRKVLLNVADRPEQCDFIFPAKVVRGDFVVSVGTGGQSPALAARVRERLEKIFGPEYGTLTRRMGRLRKQIPAGPERAKMFQRLVHASMLKDLR